MTTIRAMPWNGVNEINSLGLEKSKTRPNNDNMCEFSKVTGNWKRTVIKKMTTIRGKEAA